MKGIANSLRSGLRPKGSRQSTQCACVEVMMASAMASPRPVPPARESVRWNRSKDLVTLINWNARSAVVNREHQSVSHDLHRHADAPSGPRKLAGIVNEHADESVDRLRVRRGRSSRTAGRTNSRDTPLRDATLSNRLSAAAATSRKITRRARRRREASFV